MFDVGATAALRGRNPAPSAQIGLIHFNRRSEFIIIYGVFHSNEVVSNERVVD